MAEFVDRRSGSGGAEAEKQKAPEPVVSAPPPARSAPAAPSQAKGGSPGAQARKEASVAPPADFLHLCQMFFYQAMMSLGEIENPMSRRPEMDLDAAREFIGFLELIELKTAGNLTEPEERYLAECLHQTRLAYVARSQAPKGQAPPR